MTAVTLLRKILQSSSSCYFLERKYKMSCSLILKRLHESQIACSRLSCTRSNRSFGSFAITVTSNTIPGSSTCGGEIASSQARRHPSISVNLSANVSLLSHLSKSRLFRLPFLLREFVNYCEGEASYLLVINLLFILPLLTHFHAQ